MNQQGLAEYIRSCVSELLNIPQSDLDDHEALENYGLDSLAAAGLSGQISDWLNIELGTDMAYRHATIASISAHVCRLVPSLAD